jgi:type 1 glutamine amidotransferase
MNKAFVFLILLILVFFYNSLYPSEINKTDRRKISVLILSGKNNHEWQKTTPVIAQMYVASGLFRVNITERPDTLRLDDYRQYNVVFSNWNTWPESAFRFSPEWEADFLRFIKEGGGMIFLHAGASSFYTWDDYHMVGIGRWGKETNHGKIIQAQVTIVNRKHPVTAGIADFKVTDEIWEKTDIVPGSTVLAMVKATSDKDGHNIFEPTVLVSSYGKGRTLYTTLGHNDQALMNINLKLLLLRATQWVAGKKVTCVN